MTDLSPLIEKIEAAEEGSLDLSRGVHEAADLRVPWFAISRLSYTTSIDAIVGLIEGELPNHDWGRTADGTIFLVRLGVGSWEGNAATPALALCAAFLRVVQAKREAAG